ncbi:MAG: hypothetical protein B7Y47_11160 [Sphingomonas sp. 28-63-12]|nr:MAG: hypothetical protein B7Y47_11160 [Sphingomonas sp. 28-63-12]
MAIPIIQQVATPHFYRALASGLRAAFDGDGVTILHHQRHRLPRIIFDDFAPEARAGLARYVHSTHRHDPFVAALDWRKPAWVYRLGALPRFSVAGGAGLLIDPREEIGYRTVGWPCRQSEIGAAIPVGSNDLLQIALYRQGAFEGEVVQALAACLPMLSAAIGRHRGWCAPGLPSARAAGLTRRERQVIAQVLRGNSSTAIAELLGISCLTVKAHRKNAYRKLGVDTLAGLFALFSGPGDTERSLLHPRDPGRDDAVQPL